MARIELSFYDKKYVIEFDRESVKEFFRQKDEILKESDDPIDNAEQLVAFIKCGLIKHHKNDMPSDDDIFGWVMAMGEDAMPFMEALRDMVNDVLTVVQTDRKNLKWGKVN